jgi:hypothetical protein
VPKLVWRVKLVAELRPGEVTETEVARIERDERAGTADLGLRLAETKQLMAALQDQIVPAQVAVVGEQCRSCVSCGRRLASKGHYPVTFRSLFGDVLVRVRRLLTCPCQGQGGAKSFAALELGNDAVAPELAYVTARYAALAPFGKVAVLLSELLPMSGAQNAGTVRNRTLRVGEAVVQRHSTEMAKPTAMSPATPVVPVVVGLDGGYVRSRHRQEERHFEVIAGKVIDADGSQHRFAFARNGQAASAEAFAHALAAAGMHADTPATVLCDGDAGLWRLQRETLPGPWSCWTGGTSPCASSMRCRRRAAWPTRIFPTRRSVAWSVRSGACGTVAGQGVGAGSRPSPAGRSASTCATSPALTVFSDTSANFLATLDATRTHWCTTLPGGGAVSRSPRHSSRVRSTRSLPSA